MDWECNHWDILVQEVGVLFQLRWGASQADPKGWNGISASKSCFAQPLKSDKAT
jgi:hypothetical protein